MKLDKVKPSKSKMPGNRNLLKKIVAVLVSVLVFVGALVIINNANTAAKNTVAVIQVKAADGIPEKAVITQENIAKYDIIRKEFTDDMVLADEMDQVLNKYATHYLRKGSILHKDEIIEEKPLKNEWLYTMDDEEEVLTIPYNYLESGGDILTPGDRIRVRVMYLVDAPPADGSEGTQNPNEFSASDSERDKITKVETLFDSIEVMDMLNSSSHSIYEVYREVLRLPENQRQVVLKSPDFIKSIVPKSLVLAATSEQVNNFIQYKNASGNKSILVTILARAENSIILDQLPTLQKEIETWLERQKSS